MTKSPGPDSVTPSPDPSSDTTEPLPPDISAETASQRDHCASASDISRQPEIVIITGLAGAGRETAAHALEDLGWYVVYNIAPQLIKTLYDLQSQAEGRDTRFACVVDPRSGPFFSELPEILHELARVEIRPRLVFLTADEQTLVRRFDSVRRPHPLQGDEGVLEGIRREREQLAPLKKLADVLVDTSALNVHQLTMRMRTAFGSAEDQRLTINVMSFGFKYGIPLEADHVSDVRFIPNPYWIPELRPLRGIDDEVAEFVLGAANAEEFVGAYLDMLAPVLRGYRTENKHFTTLAFGCTGGKHRSVAIAERIGEDLRRSGHVVRVRHRDLGRE
ncbi:RNase adapter RapZ [Devriesea agamarum]|uniref:RNase adapter RapZ n=1 Tax=Devriesea agamarum TaxID=472569 RepID=UPI0009FD6ABE|nr:RNase adapter RapZ [Devriesea agamarum]